MIEIALAWRGVTQIAASWSRAVPSSAEWRPLAARPAAARAELPVVDLLAVGAARSRERAIRTADLRLSTYAAERAGRDLDGLGDGVPG